MKERENRPKRSDEAGRRKEKQERDGSSLNLFFFVLLSRFVYAADGTSTNPSQNLQCVWPVAVVWVVECVQREMSIGSFIIRYHTGKIISKQTVARNPPPSSSSHF
jgi:hypothetical protein